MKKVFAFIFCAFTLNGYSQNLLNCDLALDLTDASQAHSTMNIGDSLFVYLTISNYGPDNLDTTDFVYYGMNGLPPGVNLVAEDTGTSNKAYLHPEESFITLGVNFAYPETFSQNDTTVDYCLYLVYPPGYFVADTNGANDTACLSITYKVSDNTAIENISSGNSSLFDVYPNPAMDYVDIKAVGNNVKNKAEGALVYNIMGQVVKKFSFSNNMSETHRLDISSIPSGVYYISITGEAGTRLDTFKLIRQ